MIITIQEAIKINPDITFEDIQEIEAMIISSTNNHFHIEGCKNPIRKIENGLVTFDGESFYRVNDTVEITGANHLNGFYNIDELSLGSITLNDESINYQGPGATMYLVRWPFDVKSGAKKLIEYSKVMKSKLGIKSESIGRMSLTYTDTADSAVSESGYPSYLMDFLIPYRKLRWS